ncbi:hypothetical protein [Methylomonas koyamae]|uniref:hypothetical protein n=1 Tax=Methylomonas koyamae TaxID=702114 RepID=UPI000A40759E|nr:hypothetical protein [Methylomonas koyamae]ATG89769.1 hypothetical protein MKLM6_1522 [Methylomonas koyamae]
MFHYQIDTEIEIAAPAAKVWSILSDFVADPARNLAASVEPDFIRKSNIVPASRFR